jgi:hypothetical protein
VGDRTYCTLEIGGLLAKRDIEDLAKIIDNLYVEDGKPSRDLPKSKGVFGFSEVNYAELDSSLQKKLEEMKLSYTWSWCAGGDYGSGVQTYDARTGITNQFATCGNEICLTLSDCENPEKLQAAKAAQLLWNKIELVTYESQHDLIRIAVKKEWVNSYATLISGASTIELAS